MIQLEVGKSYEVRDPERLSKALQEPIVKIISFNRRFDYYQFNGDNGFAYSVNGYFLLDEESGYDLVKEVTL